MKKNMIVISILLIVVIGLIVVKKSRTPSVPVPATAVPSENIVQVSSQEFSQLIQDQKTFLLDVHTPEQTHIPGTDAVIPFDKLEERQNELPQDKSTPILVYCRSGNMSQIASETLANMGYTTIFDLDGGTNAYKEQNITVSLDPNIHELGTVIYGDVATTEFTLTNYSPLPLTITRVSTSCGCTKAEIEKESVEAYESTIVHVSFDPAVHKDDTDLGDLTRTIYVKTDNPNFPELQSTITATVIKKSE